MKLFFYSALASVILNFYLNLGFYPDLLRYQSGARVAEYANRHYPGHRIKTIGVLSFTLHFHSGAEVRDFRTMDELAKAGLDPGTLLFTRQPYLDSLDHHAFSYEMIESFDHYHTTMVTGTFLNHKTRGEALRKQYLLKIAGRNE
jgi:hypothetical protein